MHSNPTNIHTLHSNALRHLLQVSRDTSGQQQTPNNTNRRCQTPKKAVQGCVAVYDYVDINWRLLVSDDVLYCLIRHKCCLQRSEGCLRSFSRGIWVLFIDLFKVWMHIRVYRRVQALYCVANALYWKSSERQSFTHLTVLKHQNTKTSLYELS